MSHMSAAMAENMMQTPTGKFSKQWPEPRRFPQFLDKMGNMMSEDYDWSADIAKLPMPALLVFADNDSVSQKHIAEFFALLGGGVKEPGWLNTQLSKSRLAVVPGYSHYNFLTSTEVPQIIASSWPIRSRIRRQAQQPPRRPRRHRRRSSRPGSEAGEDRSALATSGQVRVLADAPHPACLEKEPDGADRAGFVWTVGDSSITRRLTPPDRFESERPVRFGLPVTRPRSC
jgi:hypothetical protein